MRNNKGLTLIEIILSLSILAILLLALNNLLYLGIYISNISEGRLGLGQNIRYAVDTISNDIKSANKIINSNKIPGLSIRNLDDNFGFIIIKNYSENENNFILYYKEKGTKDIIRTAAKKMKGLYPKYYEFKGKNELAQGIIAIGNNGLDFNNKKIILKLTGLDNSGQEVNIIREILITCPIE